MKMLSVRALVVLFVALSSHAIAAERIAAGRGLLQKKRKIDGRRLQGDESADSGRALLQKKKRNDGGRKLQEDDTAADSGRALLVTKKPKKENKFGAGRVLEKPIPKKGKKGEYGRKLQEDESADSGRALLQKKKRNDGGRKLQEDDTAADSGRALLVTKKPKKENKFGAGRVLEKPIFKKGKKTLP